MKYLDLKTKVLLDVGEAYICARFNNEWQGMKIVKRNK
jgi:hypothetical protein